MAGLQRFHVKIKWSQSQQKSPQRQLWNIAKDVTMSEERKIQKNDISSKDVTMSEERNR